MKIFSVEVVVLTILAVLLASELHGCHERAKSTLNNCPVCQSRE
jgi:hypothetical protein